MLMLKDGKKRVEVEIEVLERRRPVFAHFFSLRRFSVSVVRDRSWFPGLKTPSFRVDHLRSRSRRSRSGSLLLPPMMMVMLEGSSEEETMMGMKRRRMRMKRMMRKNRCRRCWSRPDIGGTLFSRRRLPSCYRPHSLLGSRTTVRPVAVTGRARPPPGDLPAPASINNRIPPSGETQK